MSFLNGNLIPTALKVIVFQIIHVENIVRNPFVIIQIIQ